MKRLSVSALLATVAPLAFAGLFAMTGCGVVEGDEDVIAQVDDLSDQNNVTLRLCREMVNTLHGKEVAAWWVRDFEDRLVAVTIAGRVQCVDDLPSVRATGVRPGLEGEPACKFCGTPLPADELLVRVEEDRAIGKVAKPIDE